MNESTLNENNKHLVNSIKGASKNIHLPIYQETVKLLINRSEDSYLLVVGSLIEKIITHEKTMFSYREMLITHQERKMKRLNNSLQQINYDITDNGDGQGRKEVKQNCEAEIKELKDFVDALKKNQQNYIDDYVKGGKENE